MRIESPKNAQVKALVKLRERRTREREGRYLIEGAREVGRALSAGVELERLYICEDFLNAEGEEVLARASTLEHIHLSDIAFQKVSYRDTPDGLLAVTPMRETSLDSLEVKQNALFLVVVGLEKPGNLGALLRTADGVDVDAVFVTGAGTDLTNPNVIRASMGSVFSRPVLKVETDELLAWLRKNHVNIVATTPHTETSYWDADFCSAVAIVLGAEHEGLSDNWLKAAQSRVSIPMRGLADSLNVGTAGALLLYEAVRQRRASSTS